MIGFGPHYATSSRVSVRANRVIKKVPCSCFDRELCLSRTGYILGRECGLFRVPALIACDDRASTIEFEYVPDYLTTGHCLAENPNDKDLIERIGSALACVHDRLQVPALLKQEIDSKWLISAATSQPIHGDFNTANVGYSTASDEVIVLDWSGAPMFGRAVTHAPRALEIAHFISHLARRQSNIVSAVARLRSRVESFLNGYESCSSEPVDRLLLARYLVCISDVHACTSYSTLTPLKRIYYQMTTTVASQACKRLAASWCEKGCIPGNTVP